MASPRKQQEKGTNPKSMPVSDVTGRDPITEEHIRFRAYLLFQDRQQRGRAGDAMDDWLQAERELHLDGPGAAPTRTATRKV